MSLPIMSTWPNAPKTGGREKRGNPKTRDAMHPSSIAACRVDSYPCVNVRFLVVPISQRPHPGCPRRRFGSLKNAPDNKSVSTDDVVIVIALSAGATRVSLTE
jgi:hypothetical protein